MERIKKICASRKKKISRGWHTCWTLLSALAPLPDVRVCLLLWSTRPAFESRKGRLPCESMTNLKWQSQSATTDRPGRELSREPRRERSRERSLIPETALPFGEDIAYFILNPTLSPRNGFQLQHYQCNTEYSPQKLFLMPRFFFDKVCLFCDKTCFFCDKTCFFFLTQDFFAC